MKEPVFSPETTRSIEQSISNLAAINTSLYSAREDARADIRRILAEYGTVGYAEEEFPVLPGDATDAKILEEFFDKNPSALIDWYPEGDNIRMSGYTVCLFYNEDGVRGDTVTVSGVYYSQETSGKAVPFLVQLMYVDNTEAILKFLLEFSKRNGKDNL